MARLQPGRAQGDERAEPGLADGVVQDGHALFREMRGEITSAPPIANAALSRETAAPASRCPGAVQTALTCSLFVPILKARSL